MKKTLFLRIRAVAVLAMLCCLFPVTGSAEVNVSVTVPLPPLVIPAPPALTIVPGTYVYYPPDVKEKIFFYRGYWYRPYRGGWYTAVEYNGAWRGIEKGRVPPAVIGVPRGFRRGPVDYGRVPYRDVKTNWSAWERDRYWDRNHVEKREPYRNDEGRKERGEQERERERHDR